MSHANEVWNMADNTKYVLIVFTDEVGSSRRDELFESANQDSLQSYKEKLRESRAEHFGTLIGQMKNNSWRIIKNVGDSLIIRFDHGDNIPKELLECLNALYTAWKKFNEKWREFYEQWCRTSTERWEGYRPNKCPTGLRIAVHLAKSDEVLVDNDLDNLRNTIKKVANVKKMNNVWPSFTPSIKYDIFGRAMTTAARLIGLTETPLFIVSENVVKKIGEENFNNTMNKLDSSIRCLPSIPLIYIKGLDTVRYDNPFYIREVTNYEEPSLVAETKRIQAIRIIFLGFGQGTVPIDELDNVTTILSSRIRDQNKPMSYYVDVALNIKRMWTCPPLRDDRLPMDSVKLEPEDLYNKGQLFPSYILFTSVPDERTDHKLRQALTIPVSITEYREIKLKLETIRVYRTSKFCFQQLTNPTMQANFNASIPQGKVVTGDFDVFLCHNSEDKTIVKKIGECLKERGILPWLDEWELQPGTPWQPLLEQQIEQIKSAAVFVGQSGIGPWQNMELNAFLRQFVKRGCPVIPVIHPDCKKTPKLPLFLEGMTWVDFRKDDPDPMEQLIFGITGKQPHRIQTPSSLFSSDRDSFPNSVKERNFYLLFFQVKSPNEPDDPSLYNTDLSFSVTDESGLTRFRLVPWAYGLVEGGNDGYVLYEIEPAQISNEFALDIADEMTIPFLNKECSKKNPDRRAFLTLISPNTFFRLSYETKFGYLNREEVWSALKSKFLERM